MRQAQLIRTLVVTTGMVIAVSLIDQAARARAQTSPGVDPTVRFEAASIRANSLGPGEVPVTSIRPQPGGRFTATWASLRDLVRVAYDMERYQDIVGNDPVLEERFDITAIAAEDVPLTPEGRERFRLMLRALLAERFALAVHREEREEDVLALVLSREDGRPGPGLTPSACLERGTPAAEGATFDSELPVCDFTFAMNDRLRAGGVTMADFARSLAGYVDHPVVDRTGLTGEFNVDMTFDLLGTVCHHPTAPAGACDRQSPLPSFTTALDEQLGLRVEPRREPVPVLVVDRVEPPAPN
jgi:uncharacterized protein (TIGR03435 family)